MTDYNYPHSHQDCPTCLNLTSEVERLRAIISPGDAAAYEEGMAALEAKVESLRATLEETIHDRDVEVEKAKAAEAKLAEAVIKLRLLPSEAAWQEGARMLQEADRARQAAEAEVARLRQRVEELEGQLALIPWDKWKRAEERVEELERGIENRQAEIELQAASCAQAEAEVARLRAQIHGRTLLPELIEKGREVLRLRGIVRYLRGILDELDYDEAGQPITWPSMERVDNALRDTEQVGGGE